MKFCGSEASEKNWQSKSIRSMIFLIFIIPHFMNFSKHGKISSFRACGKPVFNFWQSLIFTVTLFFLPLLTTIRKRAQGPGSEGSDFSMIMHPLTVLQWWSLIWRNFIFRSCHTHPTALTSIPVISDLTHISNLAYEDVNLRCAVLWAVRCTSV